MPVFPSSAIFGLSRQPQQRPLGFRDLLAQVLQDPVAPTTASAVLSSAVRRLPV